MKKKLIFFTIAVVIICLSVAMSFENARVSYAYTKTYAYEDMIPLYEITDSNSIQEKILIDKGKYTGLGLRFGTYGHLLSGTIFIDIRDTETSEVLVQGSLEISTLIDNEMQMISFDKSLDIDEKGIYQLNIFGQDLVEGQSATVFAYNSEGDSDLYMGEEHLDNKILVMEWYQSIFNLKRFLYLAIFMIVLEVYVGYVIKIVTQDI